MAFWNNRVQNLEYIFEQLRDKRIMKMTTIVQLTNSAYYPCLKNIYANVISGSLYCIYNLFITLGVIVFL